MELTLAERNQEKSLGWPGSPPEASASHHNVSLGEEIHWTLIID